MLLHSLIPHISTTIEAKQLKFPCTDDEARCVEAHTGFNAARISKR